MWQAVAVLATVFRRAGVLRGALKSKTTVNQLWVVFPAAVVVAGMGYAFPALAEDGLALALLTVIVSVAGPLVSRMAKYEAPDLAALADVHLVGVRRNAERVWRAYVGTLMDAHAEGWDFAYDLEGKVWDVKRGTATGETIRRPQGTQAEKDAVVAAAVDALKGDNE